MTVKEAAMSRAAEVHQRARRRTNVSPFSVLASRHGRIIGVGVASLIFIALTLPQLGLPGLHYDEAAEAGVNAMELLTGAPVSAFRGASIDWFGWSLPLMVQDYIGALNVYLALPMLAVTGTGVPNLRAVAVLTGLAALLLLERAVSEYWRLATNDGADASPTRSPLSWAGLIAVALLAASPSFVFWSRQGIFVTNLTEPLCCWCIWQGLRWLRTGQPAALVWSAFAGGLAIYAKLLAFWVVLPFGLLAGGWWLQQRRRNPQQSPRLSLALVAGSLTAFVIPLAPLIAFNWQTGGTLSRIAGSVAQSYYGVDNRALLHNLFVRGQQLAQTLRGDHLWYLGALHANPLAPWLAGAFTLAAFAHCWRIIAPPLLLLGMAVACSLFTVSDLFVTHYALLQPLLAATAGIAATTLLAGPKTLRPAQVLVMLAIVAWVALDGAATVRYHRTLAQSGGLADHSDAGYHLAYHLRYNGLGAPLALDWGFAATVRYLSEGTVQPVEIFGYASFAEPDADFAARLRPFLPNPDNVYLLRAPGATVFAGRREVFVAEAAALGLRPALERSFPQRDGAPLYELWRVAP